MRRSLLILVVLLSAACSSPAPLPKAGADQPAVTRTAAPRPPSPSPMPTGAPLPPPTGTPRPLPAGASIQHYPSLNQVPALAFAAGGKLWAGIAGGAVLWDLASRTPQYFPLGDPPGTAFVHDMEVMPDGAVWAATGTGASRFDGERWVSHGAGEGLGWGVYSLALAPDGAVWAGGEGGLARFDGARWVALEPKLGDRKLQNRLIWSVAVGRDGTVWATTHADGILRYEPAADRWTGFDAGAYPNARVLAVAPDGAPWVHIGYDNVYRFDGKAWQLAYASGGGQWVCGIAFGVSQQPWIATCGGFHARGSGLAHQALAPQAGEDWQFVREADGLPSDAITAVAVAPDGTIAAGSELGIGVLKNGAWQILRDGPTLARVTTAAVTPDGEAWFGFGDWSSQPLGGSVAHTDGKRWAYESPIPGVSNPAVQLLRVSPAGELWAAAGSRLARREAAGWRLVAGERTIQGGIHSLGFGDDGTIWIGAQMGVYRLLGDEIESVGGDLLPADLAVDKQGTVWIANSPLRGGGLYSYDGATWTDRSQEAPGGKPDRPLAVTADGALWVSTDDGLARHDGQGWSRVETASFLPENQAPPDGQRRTGGLLAAAPDGALWAASGATAARYAGGDWTSYDLPGAVDALAFGPNGDVWAGTENGVLRLWASR